MVIQRETGYKSDIDLFLSVLLDDKGVYYEEDESVISKVMLKKVYDQIGEGVFIPIRMELRIMKNIS